MGITAENVASRNGNITRKDQDDFAACSSQTKTERSTKGWKIQK